MTKYLGLDLGGTNIKGAIVEADGGQFEVLTTTSAPTNAPAGPDAVAEAMVAVGASLSTDGDVVAVGVGVPGLFDFSTGEIVFFTNLPGRWEGFPLRARIAEGLGVPATLINDARAFTLAESTVGAGRGCSTVACITFGTGIGGGLYINGRLHFGAFGIAGELGHQTIDPNGPTCGCGNPGCLEALARPPLIAERAGTETFEEAWRSAIAGDEAAKSAVDDAIEYLGIGLANVVTMIGPDRIVIGGGAAGAGTEFIDRVHDAVRARVTLVPPEQIEIVAATLGASAGAVGAAVAAADSPTKDRMFLAGEVPSAARRRSTQ